ncbi:UV DNA damage repair endonuclease UvsE [Clostridium rectalis]|uniref:UV DNA damage repair endonuclease UvsE n=1 Tax=Clostridium rectalis TaxID=2040295 RepID=UPI000F636132|nr:UV DNA damage repair endonuclease UvsE [Clostridium rectalis]
MKIGYACIPMGIDARTTRSFILKNFTFDRFYESVKLNLEDLQKILKYNLDNDIYMFRISSDIIPFGSHKINDCKWWSTFSEELNCIGNFIKDNNIRVSMHPGQYTILNSPSKEVAIKSIEDIEYHTRFLDALNVDYSNKIILHVGGAYNDKTLALKRFKNNFKKLSTSAMKRLVLENDDKLFNIDEVLNLCTELNIPAVFDNLHNYFNPSTNENILEILKIVKSTWKSEDGNMKIHYSDSNPEKRNAAHSNHVNIENFLNFYDHIKELDTDIMLEVKDKDISAIECINSLYFKNKPYIKFNEWSKYKYTVMEKNYLLYKECSKIINSKADIINFYKILDKILSLPYNEKNFKNTILHTWGYVKDSASQKEKNKFFKLLDELDNPDKPKNMLKKLCIKYNATYLLDSYYFVL